jgi:peptidase E
MHFRMTVLEIHMNRKSTIAALIAIAATTGSAFAGTSLAGDISIDDTAFTSTRTRAEVQAELAQFKQAGVNPWSTSYNPTRDFRSEKTREQVIAEYQASRDSVAAITGEDSGSAYAAAHKNTEVTPQFAVGATPTLR